MTLSALGRARVGNRDARCRLQEGNDAAAPKTPSPDRVKRKGFSPASSPPSSAKGRLHQTTPPWRYRGATARLPPKAPPRCRRRKIARGPRPIVPLRHRRHATAQHPSQPMPEKHPPEDPARRGRERPARPRRRSPKRVQPPLPSAHPVVSCPQGSRTGH
jgi:hypothetical protein